MNCAASNEIKTVIILQKSKFKHTTMKSSVNISSNSIAHASGDGHVIWEGLCRFPTKG